MGYFPNGAAGMDYEALYCARCIHGPKAAPSKPCTVWMVQLALNYDVCNDKDHWLHALIPFKGDLDNDECSMFIEWEGAPDPRQGELL